MKGQLTADQVRAMRAAVGAWATGRGARRAVEHLGSLAVDLGDRVISIRVTQAGVRVSPDEFGWYRWLPIGTDHVTVAGDLDRELERQDAVAAQRLAQVLE